MGGIQPHIVDSLILILHFNLILPVKSRKQLILEQLPTFMSTSRSTFILDISGYQNRYLRYWSIYTEMSFKIQATTHGRNSLAVATKGWAPCLMSMWEMSSMFRHVSLYPSLCIHSMVWKASTKQRIKLKSNISCASI